MEREELEGKGFVGENLERECVKGLSLTLLSLAEMNSEAPMCEGGASSDQFCVLMSLKNWARSAAIIYQPKDIFVKKKTFNDLDVIV